MPGPGSELKKIFSWFHDPENCQNCTDKAAIMDTKGPEWVLENIETVARWVHDNSQRLFVSRILPESLKISAVKLAIKEACRRASLATSPPHDEEKTKFDPENITGEANELSETHLLADNHLDAAGLRPAAERRDPSDAAETGVASGESAPGPENQELGEQAAGQAGAR